MSLNSEKLRFYSFVLDVDDGVLTNDGSPVPLPPKAIKLLSILVENRGRIVEKDQLMEQVWGNTFVEEGNLAYTVRLLRKGLGDDAGSPTFIENIPRRGYRFIAEVTREESKEADRVDSDLARSSTHGDLALTPPVAPALAAKRTTVDEEEPGHAGTVLTFPTVAARKQSAEEPEATNKSRNSWLFGSFAAAAVLIGTLAIAYYFISERNSSSGEKRSIAVLPFVNESGNPEFEYLSDGISETLINSLSELEQLKVIARGTAFRYKNREFVPSEVGRELQVDSVLTGKVIAVGDTLIIQADLIDTKDGSQIWGERYTKKLADLISVPENISRGIIMSLQPKLSGEASKRFAELYPGDNSKAYQLDIKGRFFWNRRTEEGLRQGVEYFEQAIAEDPNYALAYVGLADSYNIMGFYTFRPPEDAFPKAKVAARKALELNPNLAEAHNSLAYAALYFEWDFVTAEKEFLRAMKLKPNYAVAYQWYANLLTVQGRWEEAIQYHKRAGELDPLSPIIAGVPGWTYYYSRQYDKAIEACRQGIEFDPNVMVLHTWLGQAYERNGEHEEAIAEFKEALRISKGSAEVAALLPHAYAVSGNKAEAQTILNDLLAQPAQKYVSPFHLATLYTGLGDKDSAFKWLEVAYKDRQHVLLFLDHDPRLDDLRSDPRFQNLLQRVKPS